jgi:hypothetical protein
MGMSEMDLSAAVAVAASRQGGCDLDDEGGPCSECLDLVRDLIEAAAPLIAAAALRGAAEQVIDDPAGLNPIPPHRVKAWLRKRADRIEAAT